MAAANSEIPDGSGSGQAGRGRVRHPRLKRAGALTIALGCLLVVVSLWLPWVTIVTVAHFAAPETRVTVRAVDGSAGGAPFILGCPGLGLVLPLVVLAAAALDMWRRGATRLPMPLVVVAALVGLACAPLLLFVGTVSSMNIFCCFRGPSTETLLGGGVLVALTGYVACIVGCILAMV